MLTKPIVIIILSSMQVKLFCCTPLTYTVLCQLYLNKTGRKSMDMKTVQRKKNAYDELLIC